VNYNAKPMLPENTFIGEQLSLVEMCMHLSILHYVCFNRKKRTKTVTY